MGSIAGAIASIYGYKTIGGLLSSNAGLIIILIAFICVCLVFRRLLNRQFPTGTRQPVKTWVFKAIIIFMIASFTFICAFTVFYEKKKLDAQSHLLIPYSLEYSVLPGWNNKVKYLFASKLSCKV